MDQLDRKVDRAREQLIDGFKRTDRYLKYLTARKYKKIDRLVWLPSLTIISGLLSHLQLVCVCVIV